MKMHPVILLLFCMCSSSAINGSFTEKMCPFLQKKFKLFLSFCFYRIQSLSLHSLKCFLVTHFSSVSAAAVLKTN